MLTPFFTTFSFHAKTLYEAAVERLAQAFDRTAVAAPSPRDLLELLGEQRRCVIFFERCKTAMESMSLERDAIVLTVFLDHFFSVVNPAISRSTELLSKLSGAGIQGPEAATLTQEANALFTSALTLLSQFVPLHLKMFPPSPSPSQMPQPYDDPELLYVMQQIIAIGDKCAKNVKVQTAVWKLVREITLMHPYRLQNPALLNRVVTLCVLKVQSSWNAAMPCAPRLVLSRERAGELVSKGDEKAFENKVKACRFLLSVMGILSRSYAPHFVPHFGKLASFVLLIGSNLIEDPSKPGAFTPQAHKAASAVYKTVCGCIKTLFCASTLNDEHRAKLLEMFAIRVGGEDPLSAPKLQILLYLCQNLPPSILFPQAVAVLYWIMNGVETCCAQVLKNGLESVAVPTSALIYSLSRKGPQMLQEVECFLFQHLFHPHFLCSQLAVELHSFVLSNADEALQRRHIQLLANLIKTGGSRVVESLAPLFPFLVNSVSSSAKEFLLRELTEDLLNGQTKSAASEEAILYRLAAFLPAWTMRPGATEPLTTGTDALLGQIARLCVRQFTSQHVLPPQLISVAECLVALMAYERLPERDSTARTLLESLGDLLRNVTEDPLKYHALHLLPSLVDLSVLIPAFSPDMLPNFLVGYGQVMSTFPSTKPAVAQFLARCHVRLRADMQDRVLRSCAGLFQQLLADGDWTVCAETMQSFQHFAQFIPYPLESIQGLLSSECRTMLIHFLSGHPIALSKDQQPMDDAQVADHVAAGLANYTKERLAQAQACLLGSSSASGQESVEKALALLAKAAAIVSTLPPSALSSHAPQFQAQLAQLCQLLPPADPATVVINLE